MKLFNMRKISGVILLCTVLLGGAAVLTPSPAEGWNQSAQKDKGKEHIDPAPIHHSLKLLEQTKHKLASAPHHFGGHRVKALKDVEQAIKQIHEAIKYYDKHKK